MRSDPPPAHPDPLHPEAHAPGPRSPAKAPPPRFGETGTDGLPSSARLWIFGVSRPLSDLEEAMLHARLEAFLGGWKAHGHALSAACEWREGRFILIAVDDTVAPPTGCSIDHLVRSLARLESELGLEIVGSAPVWYRGPDGDPLRVSRPAFRARAKEGSVGPETIVFDLSITRLEDLRNGRFEGPARDRWHARLLS